MKKLSLKLTQTTTEYPLIHNYGLNKINYHYQNSLSNKSSVNPHNELSVQHKNFLDIYHDDLLSLYNKFMVPYCNQNYITPPLFDDFCDFSFEFSI
jgi:hypothetical protein